MAEAVTCMYFDEMLDELTLDLLASPERDSLLRHAESCARCRGELHSMIEVVDLLAAAAPECEPPMGFESRALSSIEGDAWPRRERLARRDRSTPRSFWRPITVAAGLLVVGVGGVALGRITAPSASTSATAVASGALVGPQGDDHGWVVVTSDGDRGSLTMHVNNLAAGNYRCVLRLADGTTLDVASWKIGTSGDGHWVVPIGATGDLGNDATQVSMLDSTGVDIAVADLAASEW